MEANKSGIIVATRTSPMDFDFKDAHCCLYGHQTKKLVDGSRAISHPW